jgi:hypothetical protein
MKLLSIPVRFLLALLAIAWIWSVWLCDQVREAWQKHRLGAAYEGPADNEDLR